MTGCISDHVPLVCLLCAGLVVLSGSGVLYTSSTATVRTLTPIRIKVPDGAIGHRFESPNVPEHTAGHDTTIDQPKASIPPLKTATMVSTVRRNGTTLLVRGHHFTDGEMERMCQLAKQCASAAPTVAFWVSLDTTHYHHEAQRMKEYFAANATSLRWGIDVNVHEYDSTELLKRFPALAQAHARVKKTWRHKSIGFGFHTEAVSLWYELATVQRSEPSKVWVMEGDVAYSGPDITVLFKSYQNRPADLITSKCRPISSSWWHTEVVSDAYGNRIPRANRSWSGEYVQRFSRRLLNSILDMNSQGMHAWSEQAACSMVAATNLTWISFDSRHVGSPFTFKHVGMRDPFKTKEGWLAMFKNKKKRDKLYHPVKY